MPLIPLPCHPSNIVLPMLSAPPTVERVLLRRRRWRLCRRCGCGGGAFVRVASLHVVLSTLRVDHIVHRSGQLKAGGEIERECVRKGERSAIS